MTYSPSVPEPAPGGLTAWIEKYVDVMAPPSHRFCVQQMVQFSGKRENVTMVIIMHAFYLIPFNNVLFGERKTKTKPASDNNMLHV